MEEKDEDPKAYNKRMLALKRCYEAFGMELNNMTPIASFVGKMAWAIIGLEPAADGYPEKNRINRWVKPA